MTSRPSLPLEVSGERKVFYKNSQMVRRMQRREMPPHHPSANEMREFVVLLTPLQLLTSPVSHGLDNIPSGRPCLFVGNHTLFSLDVPMLIAELYAKRGIVIRSLGDHVHFRIPLWRDLLTKFGVVDGTRDNCAKLMAAGESVLVFPGGAREVFKHKGEKYQLLWGDRLGFARLAIKYRYPIVPFAAVGAEDAWDIVLDGDALLPDAARRLLERLGVRTDALIPFVKGIGPTPLPRPERLYFSFARPIETHHYNGRYRDTAACVAVRDQTKRAIETGIAFLLRKRQRDPGRGLLPRLAKRVELALDLGGTADGRDE
jgi:1-acyl-sn-glycerol-3-phosphate acyltransferase